MDSRIPIKAFAAFSEDEQIRRDSSSGGLFSMLAKSVLEEGGAVFGAMFDKEWKVVHGYIEAEADLLRLRGSKYVQSATGKSFEDAERFLKNGRRVLFSGTPCQIAGLKKYLGKEYENLITVDIICHGVPSPQLWNWYLHLEKKHAPIVGINFRNKDNGWKRFSFAVDYGQDEPPVRTYHREDPYMMAFLDNMSLRPSCSSCQSKSGRSHSDITLADFWNVHKVLEGMDDDGGTSLVLGYSPKGMMALETIQNCVFHEVDFEQAIQFNKAWRESFPMNPIRERFFASYQRHEKDFGDFVKMAQPQEVGSLKRIKRKMRSFLNRMNK